MHIMRIDPSFKASHYCARQRKAEHYGASVSRVADSMATRSHYLMVLKQYFLLSRKTQIRGDWIGSAPCLLAFRCNIKLVQAYYDTLNLNGTKKKSKSILCQNYVTPLSSNRISIFIHKHACACIR